MLPLFCSGYSIGNYELFEPYAFLPVSLCFGMLCTTISCFGYVIKKQWIEILVCFLIFSFTGFGVLSFANVELDHHSVVVVDGTVTQKLVSSGKNCYSFFLDVQTDSYGTLRTSVTYEQSRGVKIGDSVEISVGNGLFGKKYYYYKFIGNKQYNDWRLVIDEDDEVWSYVNSLSIT